MSIASPSSSKDLDVTTIYAMFRNTIDIPGPPKGWGRTPGENDTQTADDIERVRLYQNKICHTNSSEMTTVDFNESVLDLIVVILRSFFFLNKYKYIFYFFCKRTL